MAVAFVDIAFSEKLYGERKSPTTLDELVDGWIAYQTSPQQDIDSEYYWASEAVFDLTNNYPDWSLKFIWAVLERDPVQDVIGILAAGTLEDTLANHGPLVIEQVEENAKRSPAFRNLLSGVWQNAMSDDIWQRVVKAADKTVTVLGARDFVTRAGASRGAG